MSRIKSGLKLLVYLLVVFSNNNVFSQNSHNPYSNSASLELPNLPIDKLVFNNEGAYTFAYPFLLSVDVKTFAAKYTLQGYNHYYMTVFSQDAYSLNVIFGKYRLAEGCELFLMNPDSTYFAGPYTHKHNNSEDILPTPLIQGDSLLLYYKEPTSKSDSCKLVITQIAHDYRDVIKETNAAEADAGECNINVNCTLGKSWQREKQSVVRVLVAGTSLCTGTLLNNTLSDGTPYVLTANHCLDKKSEALTSVFYFGYESSNCDGSGSIIKNNTISGSVLRATDPFDELDFALVELNSIPPDNYNIYYAGWDASNSPVTGATAIHHPRGDIKKISIDNDKLITASFSPAGTFYIDNSHLKVADWEYGTTESGSSGGPLFNKDHLVIGDLSGGEASCSNSVNDYYSKFSLAYNRLADSSAQLQYWLDPLEHGVTTWPAYDPFYVAPDVVTNIVNSDNVVSVDFGSYAQGTFGGQTEVGWNCAAEQFANTSIKNIYAITYAVDLLPEIDYNNVELFVWSGVTEPLKVLFSQTLSINNIINNEFVYIQPSIPIKTDGSFWIGYKIFNEESNISFKMAKARADIENNTLSVLYDNNEWVQTIKLGANTSLATEVRLTNNIDTLPLDFPFVSPQFTQEISDVRQHFYSKELFGIDSIESIQKETQYYELSTKDNVTDWGSAESMFINCIANEFDIKASYNIRSIKLGINNIPFTLNYSHLYVWDKDRTVIAHDSILNTKLSEQYFNQIHFSKDLYVTDRFYMGICFDTINIENNISLYQYENNNLYVDAYFKQDTVWSLYNDYGLDYNFAIQPITTYSDYHFNSFKNTIIKYPILDVKDSVLENNNDIVVYPSITRNSVYIKTKKAFYNSVSVSVYNVDGILVKELDLTVFQSKYKMSLEFLPSGVYIIEIKTPHAKTQKRIIKY